MPRRRIKPLHLAVRDSSQFLAAQLVSGMRRIGRDTRRLARWSERPLNFERDRVVLLFFEDIEADRFVRGDRFVRRALRKFYHSATIGHSVSGFEMAFRLLSKALVRAGCRVVVNDRQLAKRNPEYPVGIAGYPHVLDRWNLPNPAVLGPGLLDHPSQRHDLMRDPRFRTYLVPSEWVGAMFDEVWGPRSARWFAGIDVEELPEGEASKKQTDFLVYDKIHWDRDRWDRELVGPALRALEMRGLTVEYFRYGSYVREDYIAALTRSRGLLFLSEHETQGIAYQEALACNVPVLAWDSGFWADPLAISLANHPVATSSIPYFSPACGEWFRDASELPAALDRFLTRRHTYQPRRFVENHLSLASSARTYLVAYTAAANTAM
jgi:hypothetical protein